MYPQIPQLSLWHCRPGTSGGLGSILMSFPYSKFPDKWKEGYKEKLKEHPEIEDNLSDKLKNTNSKGFGIIHWTTHPLDLYFTSSAK